MDESDKTLAMLELAKKQLKQGNVRLHEKVQKVKINNYTSLIVR